MDVQVSRADRMSKATRIDNFDGIKIGRTQSAQRAVTMDGHCQLADTFNNPAVRFKKDSSH
jgi:hypothetical protein